METSERTFCFQMLLVLVSFFESLFAIFNVELFELVIVDEEPKPDEDDVESLFVNGNVSTICLLVSCRPNKTMRL